MTTYAQLQADFPGWAKRTDLAALIPGFVALFEARAGRKLRTRCQETSFAGTIASSVIALPAGFLAVKTLWADGGDNAALKAQGLEIVAATSTGGRPTLYAVGGSSVRFNGVGAVSGIYYAAVPSLVLTGTNWLSVQSYDAYLFGVLAEASMYQMDEQRAGVYLARADGVLQDVINTDSRDRFSGPLQSRTRVLPTRHYGVQSLAGSPAPAPAPVPAPAPAFSTYFAGDYAVADYVV